MDIAWSCCSHHSRLQGSWRGPACGDRRTGKGKSADYLSLERSRKVRHLTSFRVDGPLSEERALSSSCILDPLHARIGCFAIGAVERIFSFIRSSLFLYVIRQRISWRIGEFAAIPLYRVSGRKKGDSVAISLAANREICSVEYYWYPGANNSGVHFNQMWQNSFCFFRALNIIHA